MSVEENLNFFAKIFGTTIKENYNLIKDIYIQIEPYKKRLAGKLSGGMKQKLALSCAMIHETSGIDYSTNLPLELMPYHVRNLGYADKTQKRRNYNCCFNSLYG